MMLLPAFLLAQLLCICAGDMAIAAHPQMAIASPEENHACCDTESEKHSDRAPTGEHQHDSACGHCSGSTNLTAPETGGKLIAPDYAPFTLFAPLLIDHSALDAANRFQSFSRWLCDPSPPADLLRVKCSLQI